MNTNHRMDHIRLFATDLAFAPLVYEHHLLLSGEQRELLEDVRLSLFGYMTHADANTTTAPHDVHLYIDGNDITPSYIAVLKNLLELEEDQDRLRQDYERAMNAWIEMLDTLGGSYGDDLDRDRAARDALLAVQPFSALVDQLGNLDAGRFGALHVTNFLWSHMKLPMVSLLDVITHHNDRDGAQEIDMAQASRLTVSNGPCRLFVDNWTMPRVFGSVRLQAEMQYHNFLADQLDKLTARFDDLEEFVNETLSDILEAVDDGGPIARNVRKASMKTDKVLSELSETASELESHKQQIKGLKSTAFDLKTAVDSL
ncbi:hypothetical protein ACFL12_01230 [Pseudomonadota bacterium]